jgi:hypothetical protein
MPATSRAIDPRGELRQDPDGSWNLHCPQCGHWGEIDEDQLRGLVSCDHTNCGVTRAGSICDCAFHETRDWLNTAIRLNP